MKNRQSLIIFFAILGILFLVVLFCYTQFEIVPSTRWEAPSQEVRANHYFALEKWLNELGRPVRTLSMGSVDTILKGPERIVLLENSRFNWTGNTMELISWLREGGSLIVSLDTPQANSTLTELMESLGVKILDPYDEEDDEDDGEEAETSETENAEAVDDAENETEENTASFDYETVFKIIEKKPPVDRILVMESDGETKLVKLEIGKGCIVFTGETYFLGNYFLRKEENVNLAAELFLIKQPEEAAVSRENSGVLLIRALNGERRLLGNLAERGNPAALAVSLVLLVIAGFWMVIPSFGRYKPAPEKPGKPLRERFLAEGRFLKKYHALDKYLEIYRKDLEHQYRSKGTQAVLTDVSAASDARELSFNQFLAEQKTITEQLEKLNKLNRGKS